MAAISIEHLKKIYGRHIGVRDVSFSVEEGEKNNKKGALHR